MKGFLIVFGLLLFISCAETEKKSNTSDMVVVEEVEEVEPTFLYGLNVDEFIVDSGMVQPNQGLTHILPQYGIDQSTIYQIA